MECIQPKLSRGVPYQGLSQNTDESGSTIPRAAHLEGSSFSVTWVVHPALDHQLLILQREDIEPNSGHTCSGCNKSFPCDATPIVCTSCQCTFTDPAVASPDRKRVFKALSVSSIQGALLHYHLRRPSPVPVYCYADVFSATQTFDSTSVPSCVNSFPTSHTGNLLASPVV